MSETILIVDDSVESLQLLTAILGKALPGVQLLTRTSGVETLAAVREGACDLILLDAMMPGMTGFETCRQLKADPHTRNIPVLMISGVMLGPEHRLYGMQSGAEGYVCKPFEREELVAQVKVLLRFKRYEDQLRKHEERLERELSERTASLRMSEEQLRSLFDHSPDAIFVEDFNGIVLDVNVAACRLHGLERSRLVGRHVLDLVPPEFRDQVASDFPRWRQESLTTYEGFSHTQDGRAIPVEIRSSVIQYRGHPALLMHVRDISERQKSERELIQHRQHLEEMVQARTRELARVNEALSESRRNFHSIVEKSGDGILVVNSGGTVEYANPAAGTLLEQSASDLVASRWPQPLEADRASEFEVSTRDERTRVVEAAVHATEWHGKPAFLVFLRDTTERKHLEQHQRRTENLESVGVLAGGIAHDFNNLLAGVLGNISFAKTETASRETLMEVLGDAERAALRAKSLTQQLLTFAKGGTPVRKAGSMSELLEETARFVLAGSKTAYRLNVKPGLWNAYMDGGQMSQVLENIVINADQAMPRGGRVDITAENFVCTGGGQIEAAGLAPGRYVKVVICDQGVGMTPDVMAHIFDPYFTTKQEGSGLGLAVSYSIIGKHEGAITVASQPGHGTTFTIYVPATDESPGNTGTAASTAMPRGGGRILVMDDEEFIRTLVARMLEALGYESECVADGMAAIERYRAALTAGRRFDAVILDLTIPGGMGGEEAMEHLLAVDPDVTGIVSSGYALEPVFSAYQRHGFKGGIAKPYDMQALAVVLADVLNPRQPDPAG
ncbi:MAG: PAS domain S-box protein [Lentisphaerae bacterium]|nr:PAS domain S-box protein [Lentisphaerota bacterium]